MMGSPWEIGIFGGTLLLGLMAGWVMHRSDFCLASAFRDLFLFRSTFMLRQIALAVLVGLVLFEALQLSALVAEMPFPMMGPASWTHLLGGAVFGFGMVLAGGCVFGTLYKAGAGSATSLTAIGGIVSGCMIYGWIHPWWQPLRERLTWSTSWDLPGALGVSALLFKAVTAVFLLAMVLYWFQHGTLRRAAHAQGYLQPWHAALALGTIGALSVLLVGMPLGLTTAYTKVGAWLVTLAAPHSAQVPDYFSTIAMDFRTVLGAMPLAGGPSPHWDGISLVQYPLILGVFLGSALSARRLGEWHFRWRLPSNQYLLALTGGVMMGLASRLAPGCNVWHVLGGLPILAIGSILFTLGLFPGAWLGTRVITRLLA
jgi:uncharacterized membrane protein YedE/YeeE